MLGGGQWKRRLEKMGGQTPPGKIKGPRNAYIVPNQFPDVFHLPYRAEVRPEVIATPVPSPQGHICTTNPICPTNRGHGPADRQKDYILILLVVHTYQRCTQ